jgi:hypothetical protein
MTSLINSNIKEIKVVATNGIDANTAIVFDNDKQNYYQKNRDWILEKKKVYALKNKEHIAEYHKKYYLDHKEELKKKHREYHRNRKNNNK